VLDIEGDPDLQGFAPHTFDVVVAANVLHATADLATSLGHVKRLLAPHGMLVL
jgi:microcystin synthetase protein McyG